MAKIVLSKNAPEGQPLSAAFGASSFDAGKAQSFETDDLDLIAGAQAHPFFEVEDDKPDSKAAQRRAKEAVEAVRQRDADKRHNADKDTQEPAVEVGHGDDSAPKTDAPKEGDR